MFATSARRALAGIAPVLLLAAACRDQNPFEPSSTTTSFSTDARGSFQRYVAIGTSVSMGWRSDGAKAESQSSSWPAQLARMAGRELSLPLLDGFGCRSLLAAPLASGARESGEGAVIDPATVGCADNVPGTILPTENVAIASATAYEALNVTSATRNDPFYSRLYPKVLGPGQTQVTAMMAQNPKLVSVELGGNEVLNAREGVAIEGVSLFPYNLWQASYDAILDSVAKTAKYAVIVGLTRDVGNFPAFRRGTEIAAQRAQFLAAFNVDVSLDCDASANLLFVPVLVPTAVGTGLAYRAHGLPPYTLSCSAGPATTKDYILDPAEQNTVNALMNRMDAHIEAEATRRGYAFFRLGDLYDQPGLKAQFDAVALMTTRTPYGWLVSLDGIHPSAAGSGVLAQAAASALNARYGFGLPVTAANVLAAR